MAGERDNDIERRFAEISAEIADDNGDFGAKGVAKLDRAGQRQRKTARPHGPGPRRWDHRLRWSLIGVVLVALLAGGSYLKIRGDAGSPVNDTKPVTHGATPALSASAPVRAVTTPRARTAGPPADPFAGSPAVSYASGAAGIALPAAAAHGPYSATEVAAAYATVRKLLVAAQLDPTTLAGGSPTAFASLLTSQGRADFVSNLDKTGLDSHGDQRSSRGEVASFAPGTTKLIGSVIKVHGTMSAGIAHEGSREVLRVHVNYLFVYPVEPPGLPQDWMRVVDRSYADVDFYPWDDPGGALEPWLYEWRGGVAGARCDINDGFIHPQFPTGPAGKVRPSGAPVNPYNLSTPPATGNRCFTTTGT